MSHTPAVVGRQPIVDRDGNLVAYELLFRALPSSTRALQPVPETCPPTGNDMTRDVIVSALGLGLERLTGGRTIFCHAARIVFTGEMPLSLPPKQTVLQMSADIDFDDEVTAGARALSRAGYRLAVDSSLWTDRTLDIENLADVVKVNVQALSRDEIRDIAAHAVEGHVELVAEKIEKAEELEFCQSLPFSMFQGYYVARPATVTGTAMTSSRLSVIELARTAFDDNADFDSIDRSLRTQPSLGYQLIQLATIGRFGEMRRDIRSTRDALVWIGLNRLRGWLPALLLRPAGPAVDTNLPAVLARARFAELLALKLFPGDEDLAFTAGMISALDLLLGIPHENLPLVLDIPTNLQRAAFGADTPVGKLIGDIIDYEQFGIAAATGIGIDQATINHLAAQAFSWAMRATEAIDSMAA